MKITINNTRKVRQPLLFSLTTTVWVCLWSFGAPWFLKTAVEEISYEVLLIFSLSNISPQCLHLIAAIFMSSAQYGHFFNAPYLTTSVLNSSFLETPFSSAFKASRIFVSSFILFISAMRFFSSFSNFVISDALSSSILLASIAICFSFSALISCGVLSLAWVQFSSEGVLILNADNSW